MNIMSEKFILKNLKHKHYGGASCVADSAIELTTYDYIRQACNDNCLTDLGIQDRFLETYIAWIKNSSLNSFKGLEQFPIAAYSNGTTESFDKFYMQHNQRRFRCFRGEYMYHMASWKLICPDWKYIDDEPLAENDAVVLSSPFSDTGDVHPQMKDVLEQCTQKGIPVLIDCAFVGICRDITFDFDYPCVTDIVFSLSKTFPVANVRIGMRLSRIDSDDGLLVHKKTNYTNRLGAAVGILLMNHYSVDYNCNTWRDTQERFCQQLGIVPSKSVIFGIGDDRYSEYNRGGTGNRLCFAKWLEQGVLPDD
jgi:hypothetical protein